MSISRRQALVIGAGAALGASSGCRRLLRPIEGEAMPVALTVPRGPVDSHMRLLNRAGFGPRPGDLQRLESTGRDAWIKTQLEGRETEPLHLDAAVGSLDIFHMDPLDLEDLAMEEVIEQLQQAQLMSALYSNNQLKQRMLDFWTNHFNMYAKKLNTSFRLGSDNWRVVRKNALGNFGAMLRASAMSPAMLGYLDNDVNQKGVPNENYARELMELHTLGVDGGYTQKDIQEVARCFTGWTLETRFLQPQSKARFDWDLHDNGPKTVLGHTIPSGLGDKDAGRVLELLLKHPSTSKFLARKLAIYFLGERNPQVEAKVAHAYVKSKGEISAMLEPLLQKEVLDEAPPIIKRPFDFVVSTLRAIDADTVAGPQLLQQLRQMGQPGYEWPMPDGYPVDTEAWTGSLLARWNFAVRLSENAVGDTQPRLNTLKEKFAGPEEDLLSTLFFGVGASDPTVAHLKPALRRRLGANRPRSLMEGAALCACTPEFQWR